MVKSWSSSLDHVSVAKLKSQQLRNSLLFCGVMSKRMLMHTLLCFPQTDIVSQVLGGQTAGPVMTKFGTHMRIDLWTVPT